MWNLFQFPRPGCWLGLAVLSGMCFWAGRVSVSPGLMVAGKGARETAGPTSVTDATPPPAPVPAAVVQTHAASDPAPGWDAAKWDQLHGQPGTLARNAALAALLEKLAATDPHRAMAIAQAEGNLKLRDELMQAVLHGWARTAPLDAAGWAKALPDPGAREAAMNSVFAGMVAADPDAAMRAGTELIQQDPGEAISYGSRLIDAFCNAGDYAAAAQLAVTGEDNGQRSIWLAEAYSKWAELQPEQAAQAALAIADPAARNEALHGIVGGWSGADPAGLTQFLYEQPPGSDRGQMLGQALESWARQDPAATGNWINSHAGSLGSDMDKGLQSIATLPNLPPDLATAWAENISDPTLRSATLDDVLRDWVHTDLPAAKAYFDNSQNLLPADRQQITEILADLTGQAQVTAQ